MGGAGVWGGGSGEGVWEGVGVKVKLDSLLGFGYQVFVVGYECVFGLVEREQVFVEDFKAGWRLGVDE